MKILVDISKVKDLNCGLGQFSYHLSKELIKIDKDLVYFLEKEDTYLINGSHSLIKKKWQKYLPYFFNPKVSVWHATHQDIDIYPLSKGIKKILTIHDLNFLKETSDEKMKRHYLSKLQKKIQMAHSVTFISHFTKNECEHHLNLEGKNLHVIYNGFCLEDVPACKPKGLGGIKGDYILCLGTVVPKKNFELAIEIAKANSDLTFVIAGTIFHEHAKQLIDKVKSANLSDRVIFLGEISESEKVYLYENAKLFFHPSLLEGFGLPVVEAMAKGLPVVSSNACSLPEVLGGFGHLFDPLSIESALSALRKCLAELSSDKDEAIKTDLIDYASRYSWKKSARDYYDIYRGL